MYTITRIKIYLPRLSPASNLRLEFYATENWPLQTENLRVSQDDPRPQSSKCHSYLKFSNQLKCCDQKSKRIGDVGVWGLFHSPDSLRSAVRRELATSMTSSTSVLYENGGVKC